MRVGLGWRRELGAGIVANLDRIEVVEVLAEELFEATAAQRRAMRFLAAQVPVVLHATSLGLASAERVDEARLERVARVVGWLEPQLWSEHLAFVRSEGIEIGHLAAPPRNDATLEGLLANYERARLVTGSAPLLENVASLVEPPASVYAEGEWLHAVLAATGCELLLDLHNLHANAANFGFDAAEVVRSLPHSRVGVIHLAGGRMIERGRILDDHLHPVPSAVLDLLSLIDAPQATVIVERDGRYPPIEELLEELALAAAVAGRRASPVASLRDPRPRAATPALQPILARLYTDAAYRSSFEATAVGIDPDDLALAARSFEKKRLAKCERHALR